MFNKSNYINTIWDSIEKVFKAQFPTYNVSHDKLEVTTIPKGVYYISIMYPFSSKLRYAAESYNSEKRRTFMINVFVCAENDYACNFIVGKIVEFVDHNQNKFSEFGLRKVECGDFAKLSDSKIVAGVSTLSAYMGTLKGEIWL